MVQAGGETLDNRRGITMQTSHLDLTGVLDEAYERLHRTGPEFNGYLSNHGPMASEARVQLGQGSMCTIGWTATRASWKNDRPVAPGSPRRGRRSPGQPCPFRGLAGLLRTPGRRP